MDAVGWQGSTSPGTPKDYADNLWAVAPEWTWRQISPKMLLLLVGAKSKRTPHMGPFLVTLCTTRFGYLECNIHQHVFPVFRSKKKYYDLSLERTITKMLKSPQERTH